MPKPTLQIRVVVASPSDVATERAALDRVVDEINQTMAAELGVNIALSRWETAAAPGFRPRGPQYLIDEILDIPNCDIFIGIFWKRFGTPVDDSGSGTEHEFKQAFDTWRLCQRPQIMFYFSEQPSSPKDKSEVEQWGRVLDFKQNFPKEGLWWPYAGPTEFESIARRHLVQQVLRLTRTAAPPKVNRPPFETLVRRSMFVGRTDELARLHRHIEDETNALIVLEGIAGIGKSTLARKLSSQLTTKSHPCFWHECRAETTLDSVIWAISKWSRASSPDFAAALDEMPDAERQRVAYLTELLARQSMLVFLDDYHLVRDPMLEHVLAELADLQSMTRFVLVSRRRPNILMRVPAGSAIEEHLSQGLDEAACAQFLEQTGITVDSQTVGKVWKLTGAGHPKALQLLAHRAHRIPVRQLLSTLPVFRVDLVREWLNPLLEELDDDERATMLDLSIFERPLPFTDVHRLLPDRSVDSPIGSLLERFLIDPVSEGNFQMHPLVREFCAGLIEEPRNKHQWAADYYRDKCGPLDDPDFAEDTQIEALLAAWSHCIKAENHAAATEVVEILRPPLMNRGHYEQILQLVQDTSPPDSIDADFFKIHLARLRSLKGDFESARAMLMPLINSDNSRTLREAVLVLSAVYNEHGKTSDAWDMLESNRSHFSGTVSSRTTLRFLSRVVQALIELRDYDKALEWARRLTDVSEAAGDKITGAIGLRQMAFSFLSQHKFDTALELTKISLELLQSVGRVRESARTQLQIAQIHIKKGDKEQGRVALEQALDTFTSVGDRIGMGQCRQISRDLGP